MTFFFVSLKRKKSLNNSLTERGVFLLSLFITKNHFNSQPKRGNSVGKKYSRVATGFKMAVFKSWTIINENFIMDV